MANFLTDERALQLTELLLQNDKDIKTEIEGKVHSADCGDIISHNASEFAVANHNHKIEDLTQTDYIIFNCGSSSTVI